MTRSFFVLAATLSVAAQASPTIQVTPQTVKPGDPVLVLATGFSSEPIITLGERALSVWRDGEAWRAIGGLPVEQESGTVRVAATLLEAEVSTSLKVEPAEWRTRELTVAPKFTETTPSMQERLAADRKAFAETWSRPFGPPLFAANFVVPRESRITAPFGDRRTFNGKVQSQHYGTDYDGRVGDPIRAANDGVVAMVRDNVAAGKTVVIAHGAGVFTTYFHLSQALVKNGQKVRRGQLVGKVGRTGRVTGPHLHFGARIGDFYVDAESLLRLPIPWTELPAAPKKAAAKKPSGKKATAPKATGPAKR